MAAVRKAGELWRCEACGNVVKVVKAGGGQLMCCGGPMARDTRQSPHDAADAARRRRRT